MSDARVAEMNRILDRPPALGLSVEPTLGIYVIAKLAHRHNLDVELIRGVPGITAKVTIPRDHLETPKEPEPRPWGSGARQRVATEWSRSAKALDYADAETRDYVRKRAHEAVPSADTPISANQDEMIDLTQQTFTGPARPGPTGGLPVRTPGRSFKDDDDEVQAVSPGGGASRIKSALAEFDRGRRSAEDTEEESAGDDSEREDRP
jgi:hypothetical protein